LGEKEQVAFEPVTSPAISPKLQHFDEQGFIAAPEYGQARVIPTPSRPGKTAGSTTIPNGRRTS
jgi:hypothetical protein